MLNGEKRLIGVYDTMEQLQEVRYAFKRHHKNICSIVEIATKEDERIEILKRKCASQIQPFIQEFLDKSRQMCEKEGLNDPFDIISIVRATTEYSLSSLIEKLYSK